MEQLTNARRMEKNLTAAVNAIQNLGDAIKQFAAIQSQTGELNNYFHGTQWQLDRAALAAGQLPGVDPSLYNEEYLRLLLAENENLLNFLAQWANA